jgi:hypothetical protein
MTGFLGLVTAGAGALAVAQDQSQQGTQATQDSSSHAATDKSAAMKECMARQKANNTGLTHLQMKTTCRNEVKAQKTRSQGNDLATGPQSGDTQPKE